METVVNYAVTGSTETSPKYNSAMLKWRADGPPMDWTDQIARSERFYIVGT
jgi:hypothetical protein